MWMSHAHTTLVMHAYGLMGTGVSVSVLFHRRPGCFGILQRRIVPVCVLLLSDASAEECRDCLWDKGGVLPRVSSSFLKGLLALSCCCSSWHCQNAPVCSSVATSVYQLQCCCQARTCKLKGRSALSVHGLCINGGASL